MFIPDSILKLETKLGLPPRKPIRYLLRDETGWANHYGGIEVLSNYCGLIPGMPLPFEATWQHGIVPHWIYRKYPLHLTYYVKHPLSRLILVQNEDQEKCLNLLGYTNVHAIGAPYIYAQPQAIPRRINGSVLIMPPHALDNAPFEYEEQLLSYRDYIVSRYRGNSRFMCACIHMSCVRNGQWPSLLAESGIQVITGSDHGDSNSLHRMWRLFSQFETVSTPSYGSHVYYALAAGCRVVIEGPQVNYTHSQKSNDTTFQRAINEGYDYLFDESLVDARNEFNQLFRSPRMDPGIAFGVLGASCKKTPLELRRLLQWSLPRQVGNMLSIKAGSAKNRLKSMVRRRGSLD